jgi:hypothetical protein
MTKLLALKGIIQQLISFNTMSIIIKVVAKIVVNDLARGHKDDTI